MRIITLVLFISSICNSLTAQLSVDESGNLMVERQTKIVNEESPVSLRLTTGYRRTNVDQTGIYNYSRRGSGSRIGIDNLIRAREGHVFGVYNDIGAWDTNSMMGVFNYLGQPGAGDKTGILNIISDVDDREVDPESSLIGIRSYVKHYNRPTAYGSKIVIRKSNADTSHQSYGYYVDIKGSEDAEDAEGAYGVYSRVTGANNYAGYFIGNVSITGNLVETSDARLKTDKKPIENALDVISKLQPKEYKFKKNNRFGYDATIKHYGFMAQEVEKVLPSLVHEISHPEVMESVERKNDRRSIDVDADDDGEPGFPTTEDILEERVLHPAQTLKGVRYTDLIAILTQAIQEQQTEISKLKKRPNKKALEDSNVERQLQELEALAITLQEQNTQLRKEIALLKACNDCTNDVGSVPQSSHIKGQGNVSIFPNPASDHITIMHDSSNRYGVEVTSSDGKIHTKLESNDSVVNISTVDWKPGTYFVNIIEGGQLTNQLTVLIQR